jgi:hypothetical protein
MERLAYRNRFVKELVQNLEGYVAPTEPPVPQVISGPDNTIVLQVSFEEWERLLSSVYTGADICYPEISDTVRWVLLRAVEQPVSICDMIINCINTNPATRAALRDFVLNDDAIQQMIQNQINAGKPINPEIGILQNDDLDALFGAVTFLVDTIHDAIVDFNDDAEASTNSRELGQIIFEAIPIVETLPFNEVSDYIDTLYNQIIEVFDSQWDTTPITGTRDRIRCALFCIARDNGNGLTWDLIQDYFYQRTGFNWSTTLNIMLEFANFVTTGTWSGEEVVDISFGNFAAAMSGMGKFGEMLFPSLTSIMRLGQNNPDSDWEIVCEDCTPEPRTPVINSLWDPTRTAGTLEGPDEDGYWIATTTSRGTDEAITLMDELGRDFVFEDVTYSVMPNCQVFLLDEIILFIGCTGSNHYTGQIIDEWTCTWAPGAARTMRFRMVAP